MKLAVSGAFIRHTCSMQRRCLKRSFRELRFNEPAIPIYSNEKAALYESEASLFRQVSSPVLWKRIIEDMALNGVRTFIEVGAGKTLSVSFQKIVPDALVCNAEDTKSLGQDAGSPEVTLKMAIWRLQC